MKHFIKCMLITMAIAIPIELMIIIIIHFTIPSLHGISSLLGFPIGMMVMVEVFDRVEDNP